MQSYEQLGAFYLGRVVDPVTGERRSENLLYDAKDLTTHAVCVGMTGSGKTGLCLSLLEEAAIDGIPVIAIDPKGDLGNLLLTFPDLLPEDFAPWVDPGEAVRKGMEPAAYAKKVANLWRNGLADWDQDGERIRRFREACDLAIYTPGSNAGLPLTVLRSFAAPAEALRQDTEALNERVMSAVSGLLGLLGYTKDPIQSREHILLSNILTTAWQEGRDLGLGDLIREIQDPPFDKVGFFDLESFFPSDDRMSLAMAINNLLASPSFASWMQGEPLDIARLLRTPAGKPRISVLSIAHLSEEQRMFFVTLLLNELVAWMRTQAGTTSLRAILYMDEVFGYFPPTAKPPSKQPMLTLLKQARAYGVGCVLATQNPVDLDYKGLSNTGTWFLGRLQTERDKARVLDGLEGASASAGAKFDRQAMETTLSGLQSRVFLMNNVHDDAPVLFHTRWAMSYLRGPLTREHIQKLMAARKAAAVVPAAHVAPKAAEAGVDKVTAVDALADADNGRPILDPEIHECLLVVNRPVRPTQRIVYRPGLLGKAKLHFVSSPDKLDEWQDVVMLARLEEKTAHDPWEVSEVRDHSSPDMDSDADQRASFAALPKAASQVRSYKSWAKDLKDHLYRTRVVTVWRCKSLKMVSEPGELEGDFRSRLAQKTREERDFKLEKLRKRSAPKLGRLQERIQTAHARVEKEQSQYQQSAVSTVLSVGSTLLGALFGRKVASAGNVRSAATSVRRAGRAKQEKDDIGRAKAKLKGLQQDLVDMEEEYGEDIEEIKDACDVDLLDLTRKDVRPRKADIDTSMVVLAWMPWHVDQDGISEPLFE